MLICGADVRKHQKSPDLFCCFDYSNSSEQSNSYVEITNKELEIEARTLKKYEIIGK